MRNELQNRQLGLVPNGSRIKSKRFINRNRPRRQRRPTWSALSLLETVAPIEIVVHPFGRRLVVDLMKIFLQLVRIEKIIRLIVARSRF